MTILLSFTHRCPICQKPGSSIVKYGISDKTPASLQVYDPACGNGHQMTLEGLTEPVSSRKKSLKGLPLRAPFPEEIPQGQYFYIWRCTPCGIYFYYRKLHGKRTDEIL